MAKKKISYDKSTRINQWIKERQLIQDQPEPPKKQPPKKLIQVFEKQSKDKLKTYNLGTLDANF